MPSGWRSALALVSGGTMNHALRASSWALAGMLTVWALPAAAQERSFYLDRIQISGAPDDGYTVFRPRLYEKTRFYGALSLGYTLNPLRDETITDDADIQREIKNPVSHQLITYLNAGAEIAGRVGVGVQLPVGVFMAGKDPAATSSDPDAPNAPVETVALHDMRFDVRLPLLRSDDRKKAAGVGAALWAPTGNVASFASDDQITGWLFANGEYDFGPVFINGMIGPHFRPVRDVRNSPLIATSELRWAFGGFMPLRDNKVRLGVELWGSTGLETATAANGTEQKTFFGARNTDLEWLAQGRFSLDKRRRVWAMGGAGTRLATGYGAPDVRVLATLGYWFPIQDTKAPSKRVWAPPPDVTDSESDRDGDGFPDNIDKCPDIPEDGKDPDPTDGCPAGADRDGDGIPDDRDRCPDTPEDKDGVEDDDGCPEKDADNDTIPDAEDKCPTEPGPASKIAEKHGCPSLTKFDENTGEIVLLEPIQFEYNSATIKAVSFPILDEVVAFLKSRGDAKLGVYGHTDSRGSDAYNLRLSKMRAKACVDYLARKGISAGRLESEGFGESKPKCTDETEECWTRNRRTEFKLLE
jgi:outer membrane protein OmpA-like peptidoglycan-associated protein